MKLLFKQRLFSWLDSYDVYDEDGQAVFSVEGRVSFGHRLDILNAAGEPVGRVQEEVFTLLPRFQLYLGEDHVGEIRKEFTFFRPSYRLDCNDWRISGDFFQWEYAIEDPRGRAVAWISKEVFHLTDTYVLDVANAGDAVAVLMVVLAIDAAQCSSSS